MSRIDFSRAYIDDAVTFSGRSGYEQRARARDYGNAALKRQGRGLRNHYIGVYDEPAVAEALPQCRDETTGRLRFG